MSKIPIFHSIRLISQEDAYLNRRSGSKGEIFYNKDSDSLTVFNGLQQGGIDIARSDLTNVSDASFLSKASAAGLGNTTVSVSESTPQDAAEGNLWLNISDNLLYIYVNDQWIVASFSGSYNDLTNKPTLSNVATSGDYNNLLNLPAIPSIGSITFTGTVIDSNDSSSITFTPAVELQSDLTVDNEIYANIISVANINVSGALTSTGSATPEIVSDNEIIITPGTTTILNGLTTFSQTTEIVNIKSGSTGVVDHDFSTGALFLHTNLSANFTANIVNMPTTNNRSISIALFLDQGATAFIPNALQIDGSAQTIKWSGGSPPLGTNNYLDIVNFTLIRANNTWTVIGSLSTYN